MKWILKALTVSLSAVIVFAPTLARSEEAALKSEKSIVVPGGAGGYDWMVVDNKMRRLLAGHKGTGTLAVLDLDTEKVLDSIKTGAAQGVAVDTKDNKYFIGDDTEQKIVIVDRNTLKITGEIKVTGPVDAIAYDSTNDMIYADHDDGTDVWVIDGNTEKLVATVKVPEAPEWIEYDKPSDRLYQNIKSNNTVQVIDPSKNTVEAVWKTDPATGPHGLAIDHKTQRVFSAGNNGKLVVFDIKTAKIIATVDIEKGVDQIAFDAGNKHLYCACHGFISVVEETEDGAKLIGSVPAPKGSHTLTVDRKTHSVWVSYADSTDSYLQKFTLPEPSAK